MAENEKKQDNNESEEAESTRPLPPLMQSVVDGLRKHAPNLEPVPRDDEWVEVNVPADEWSDIALILRDELGFDYLNVLSGVDYKEKGFQVVYHLLALEANKKLVVKVDAPDREDPVVPTVMNVWPTADFHEREAWDMFGIRFEGHPDLRRILMREDWVGHPLRKDYVDERVPRERQTRESYAEALRQSKGPA